MRKIGKKLLIGFSGPSGSGKTTMVNDYGKFLRGHRFDVAVVKEVARDVFVKWKIRYGFQNIPEIRRSDRATEFQLEVLKEQIRREEREISRHDIVLTDRTIYDNLFFALFWHDNDYEKLEEYMEYFKEVTLKRYLGMAKDYDLIFFCEPLKRADVDDGFRTPDLPYRKVQEFVISYLIPAEIPVVTLKDMPLDDRRWVVNLGFVGLLNDDPWVKEFRRSTQRLKDFYMQKVWRIAKPTK